MDVLFPELEPKRADWVAFNADGFPIGFASAAYTKTIGAAAKEFPTASRIELVDDPTERRRLLDIHSGNNA